MGKDKILTFVGIGIIILAAAFFVFKITNANLPSGNVISEGTEEYDEIKNSCECVERNNFYCLLDGFKVDEERKLCVGSDGRVTKVVLGCSKFDCNGTIYEVKKYG